MSASLATGNQLDSRPIVGRQTSIDVFRGIVMFLMLAEVMQLMTLVQSFPESLWAQWLAFHTTHVEWVGCSLHDMIQPGFSFLVGVSLPFSIAARKAKGMTFGAMARHAFFRSVILILLGIALRSLGRAQTNFFFVDTLTQIGLGYFALFWIAHWSRAAQVFAISIILIGYWSLFAAWPLPREHFDWSSVGVPEDWPHMLTGFAAHWNKNANPAWYFDVWFMNLFPQSPSFKFNGGGYSTLNFIPTLATMILGVLAGRILKEYPKSLATFGTMFLSGLLLFLTGWALGEAGICPVVKRIWTPSWVLYSGGISFVFLSILFLICDIWRFYIWSWPLLIIGSNSIAAYVMSGTMKAPIKAFLIRHLGDSAFMAAGSTWYPIFLGAAVLVVIWLILYWLYRQRVFIRI